MCCIPRKTRVGAAQRYARWRQTGGESERRWLPLVAHDTNIAMVRTLMNFSWQLPGYSRGNIPPGSSLVLERWRNAKSGERYLRVYFQAQGLDDLRRSADAGRAAPDAASGVASAGCRQDRRRYAVSLPGGYYRPRSAYRPIIRPAVAMVLL